MHQGEEVLSRRQDAVQWTGSKPVRTSSWVKQEQSVKVSRRHQVELERFAIVKRLLARTCAKLRPLRLGPWTIIAEASEVLGAGTGALELCDWLFGWNHITCLRGQETKKADHRLAPRSVARSAIHNTQQCTLHFDTVYSSLSGLVCCGWRLHIKPSCRPL